MPVAEMLEIDRWILARTEDLIRRCRGWYDTLEFHKVYRAIYDFATADLSARYFDILKDRLYTAATTSHARRSGQTRAVQSPLRADAADGAAAGVHRGRGLGLHRETGRRSGERPPGAASGAGRSRIGLAGGASSPNGTA